MLIFFVALLHVKFYGFQERHSIHTLNNSVLYKQASHGLWGSAGLKMPIFTPIFHQAVLTCKVGQTDLVFGVRSGFISRSVYARLQVSVCIGYDLCHPG